jgi:type I restriction enzyme S subunit
MEVRPGYKRTEVGVIPEDWQTPTLGCLTVLMTNGFVGTATTYYTNNDNGILYIQGYNVEENSFNFHGIKFVTEVFHKAHMKSCLRSGDLLTVQTGEVGLTTIVPESLAGSNCHALIISRFDQGRVSPAFISYYLNSKPGRSRLRLIETGTTMKHLNVGDVLQFRVPLPPTKDEQQAIAEVLRDADALIESLEQLMVKKRNLKQSAMQQLLTGRTRLPGFQGEWEGEKPRDNLLNEEWRRYHQSQPRCPTLWPVRSTRHGAKPGCPLWPSWASPNATSSTQALGRIHPARFWMEPAIGLKRGANDVVAANRPQPSLLDFDRRKPMGDCQG